MVVQAFLDTVYKLHSLSKVIVSYWDAVFTSNFLQEFFHLQGVSLNFSNAYHPRFDEQTEVVNRSLETYLRFMTSDLPNSWVQWLPLAQFWYNTSYHSSIRCFLFRPHTAFPLLYMCLTFQKTLQLKLLIIFYKAEKPQFPYLNITYKELLIE